MKKILSLFAVLIISLILQSFIGSYQKYSYKYYELKDGETIEYITKPDLKKKYFSGSYRRSSFDLSKYNIEIDTQGHLLVSKLRACKGKHQGEISLFHSKGSISRIRDTLKISSKTIYDKFYVFSINENGIVDSFSSDIKIDLVSKTLKNKYCPNMILILQGVSICALPEKINSKEISKTNHKDNTIGEFSYFAIKDSESKLRILPHSDYIIIGADIITLLK